ncbi:MAG: hypothetical protein LM590_09690 [Thermofilum sp.]|nr:hypothetical protein [Thermofilum sp.]
MPGVLHVRLRLLEEGAERALRGAVAARCKHSHQSVGGRPWCSGALQRFLEEEHG